jgi:ABC-type bacteriocin/lantibiotic exporter with double-glycine peptidase domain
VTPELFSRFWFWARPHRRSYVHGLAWLIATNALALGIPWMLRGAIHDLTAGTSSGRLAAWAGGMTALAVLQACARTISRLAILGASRRIAFDVREAFFAKLLGLDATFYDGQRTGDLGRLHGCRCGHDHGGIGRERFGEHRHPTQHRLIGAIARLCVVRDPTVQL